MKSLVSLGSVSHGTMRNEDLIPTFVDLLSDLNEKRSLSWKDHFANETEATAEFSRLDTLLGKIEQRINADAEWMDENPYWETEDASEDCQELFSELERFAPDYCYFGAHPGDGSDYGFWISEDAIADAEADDGVLKVSDTSEVPDDHTGYVLHVNDHGNATLYWADNGKLDEIWSCV